MKKEELKKYLEEELSDKERNALEKELADDPFFSESMEGLEQWKAGTTQSVDALEKELHQQVDKKVSRVDRKGRVWEMPLFRILLAAACITGICLFSLNYFLNERAGSEKIFAYYYKPLTNPDATVRGENAPMSKTESQAVKSYETENYKQAIYYYKKLSDLQPNNQKYALFLGISYLANHQPEQAIEVLNKTYSENTNYDNDKNWYLALAYIRMNNMAAAKSILQQLSSIDSYYKEPATELLKALN